MARKKRAKQKSSLGNKRPTPRGPKKQRAQRERRSTVSTLLSREHVDRLLLFRQAMDRLGDPFYLVDPETLGFIDFNEAACKRSGYSREELLHMGPGGFLLMSRKELKRRYDDVIAAGDIGIRTEQLVRSKEGRIVVSEIHRRRMRYGDRWIIVSVSRDITQRKQLEETSKRMARMYAALSETNEAIMRTHSPEELYQRVCNAAVYGGKLLTTALILPDPDTASAQISAVAGAGEQELRAARISVDPATPEGQGLVGTAFRTLRSCISNDFLSDPRTRLWHASAKTVGILAGAAVPLIRSGRVIGVLLFYSDEKDAFDDEIVKLLERMSENVAFALENFEREDERKRAEKRIQYLATHDGLTGLPNRTMFSQLLNLAIESARRYERKFAVLFVDLDRFKIINDTLGHEAGDSLLKEVASRLKSCLRSSDVVARLGGDEFVILVQEVGHADQVALVARKVLSAVIRPFSLHAQECRVTASIGVSIFPTDADDESSLMKSADIAMYLAKEEGKNNFQFYSHDVRSHSLERLALEANLRRALERNELSLHYQAKVDLKTRRINGVEALLRWESAELGTVSPTQLIPVAEETGLIVPIGRWVLHTACAQNVAWQRAGLPRVCMAVNLSPRQFADADLIKDIAAVLEETGMAPELLELEITESMVVHRPDRAVRVLTEIKQMGVRIAIDDFGTGYSSLAQLKRYPIDTLKVDRSFIRELSTDGEDRAITEAIIAMGKSLSLTIVAEGVETEEQQAFLTERACDEMQGYYFSKPVVPAEFEALLRKNACNAEAEPSP